ncbi:MAG: hypothetical protein WDM88_12340 [Galbitalea sp.]
MAESTGIDPRGPRFGAGITGVLLLVVIGLSLAGLSDHGLYLAAQIVFAYITLVFAWAPSPGSSATRTASSSRT